MHGWGQDLGNLQKMYLQGQKKSPISGKSLGLGFFSLRESFHFLVWLCSLGLRPRLHNCQTAKFIPWSDCVASASGLGYTTVRPRNENFLSRKRNPGRELFHLWSTCFRPYRTFILQDVIFVLAVSLCQNNPDLPRKNWGWNNDADSITLWYNKWF